MTVRLGVRGDAAVVAAMLARAFGDDPVFAWIFPDPVVRPARLQRLFRQLYASDLRGGTALVTPAGEAATLWRAPGRAQVGWGEMLRHAVPLIGAICGALPRALAAGSAIDAHMPVGDFWYLHIAGCDPAMQGRGLGRQVLTAGLSRFAGRLPCYLETALERNLGFYASAGFRVTGEWRIRRDGPRMWSMLRAPD